MIRELKQELEALKKGGAVAGGGGGGISDEMKAEMEEQKALLEQMQKERDEYEEKLAAQRAQLEAKKKEQEDLLNSVHLRNINPDPSMSGQLKKLFKEGENYMGKQTRDFEPDILISGVGISPKHCLF